MGPSRRWLVCGGPLQFIDAATVLLGAGGVSGIEWEPLPSRAFVRVASAAQAGGIDVIVMDGAFAGNPYEVSCTVAEMGAGSTVLCIEGASNVAGQAAMRGVTAAVEPRALAGLIGELVRERLESTWPPLPGDGWGGEPLPDEVLDAIADDEACDVEGRRFRPDSTRDVEPEGQTSRMHGGIAGYGPLEWVWRETQATTSEIVRVRPGDAYVPEEAAEPGGACMESERVPTICFASARGGVGKSALAALSALVLASEGFKVAVIDLDFQFGTVLGYLGADETDGLFDADSTPCAPVVVDSRSLARCRTRVCPGVEAYEFCRAPEHAEILAPGAGALLAAARTGADVAIVDLPSGVSEVTAQAFELSDRCLLVGDHRALSLESLGLQQALCARIGVPRAKLVTVLNRCDPRHRDEGFLARAPFELQTSQIMRVADGGAEVMQMLAIGGAAELMALRNRFALSTADLVRSVCTDIGCIGGAAAARPALPAGGEAEHAGPGHRARRKRRERKGDKTCRS